MHARNSLSSLVVGSLLMGSCHIAISAENNELAVPMGVWGLDSAILPLSGVYGQVILPSYRATSVKDANGNDMTFSTTIPSKSVPGVPIPVKGSVDARIQVDAVVPKLVYVSEEPILGGRYGGYIAVPLLDKSRKITVNVTTPLPPAVKQQIGQVASQAASGDKSGLGDIELAAFLGWKFENLSVVAAMNLDLPTGSFDAKSMVNLGTNYYSFRPLVSAAWSTESGFDVAASFAYNVSTANRDTSYKSGQYVHIEYVGTFQFNNNVKAGLQGYYLNQTTDDKDPNGTSHLPIVNGNRARVTALGPVMSYQTDDLKTQVELKYLREMSARARPEGDLALITLSRLF
jgi:hypothetical protein